VITLESVTKRYGARTAVDALSLRVEPGEVLGLLGPNGAGKSTTVSLIAGVLAPDAGSVQLDGLGTPTTPAVRRHLGVAPQTLALYDGLSGRENLRFFGQVYGLAGAHLEARVAAVIEAVGLTERADDASGDYSGGMKRRLNLAAALVHDPAVLLLDEPTAGVDPQSRLAIFDTILHLHHQGRTIIYTTHYMEEAARLCSRVAVIDEGRLLALGTVAALLAAHDGAATLEDVFLRLTGRGLRD
jgi:ABC-2 type transport system ATP-binding protein